VEVPKKWNMGRRREREVARKLAQKEWRDREK